MFYDKRKGNLQLVILLECDDTYIKLLIGLNLKLTPSLAHAQIYLPTMRTIIQAPLPLQILKSRSIVDVERNIYLQNSLYFLKMHFAFHHKHKDNTTVALEK
jgi:hypothetical protein